MRRSGWFVLAIATAALMMIHAINSRPVTIFEQFGAPNSSAPVKLSPDGSKLIVLDQPGSVINVWNRATKTATQVFVSYWSPDTVDFSPDGRYLVVTSWALRVWDLQNLRGGDLGPNYVIPLGDGWKFTNAARIEVADGKYTRQFDLSTGHYLD